jgi:hypothetical protein
MNSQALGNEAKPTRPKFGGGRAGWPAEARFGTTIPAPALEAAQTLGPDAIGPQHERIRGRLNAEDLHAVINHHAQPPATSLLASGHTSLSRRGDWSPRQDALADEGHGCPPERAPRPGAQFWPDYIVERVTWRMPMMNSWDINSLDRKPHAPQIPFWTNDVRSIALAIPGGKSVQDHQDHERAWVSVRGREVEIATAAGKRIPGAPGLTAESEPAEPHARWAGLSAAVADRGGSQSARIHAPAGPRPRTTASRRRRHQSEAYGCEQMIPRDVHPRHDDASVQSHQGA